MLTIRFVHMFLHIYKYSRRMYLFQEVKKCPHSVHVVSAENHVFSPLCHNFVTGMSQIDRLSWFYSVVRKGERPWQGSVLPLYDTRNA